MKKNKSWPRRAEFINTILVLAAFCGDVSWINIELDGVAGKQFDRAIKEARRIGSTDQCNDYIQTALKMGVPVRGLEADGELGEKWDEVVALCKAGQKPHKKLLPKRAR